MGRGWSGAALLMLVLLSSCKSEKAAPSGKGRGPTLFPVEVATVKAEAVEYAISAVGSVEAFEEVQITARVAGVVDRVRFAEGERVKQGEVIAEIDASRYRLAVEAARAALRQAEAAEAEAKAALARRESVNEKRPGLLPAEEMESFRTRAGAGTAQAQAQRVALEQAQLNLKDALVRAPMGGVLQTRTVQTGQYVQMGTVLATLLRRDPLLLRFNVAEGEAAPLAVGKPARFTIRNRPQVYEARIRHVAEAANATRMVAVTAEVEGDAALQLRPGIFATVQVPIEGAASAPVIPQTAVRPSERGFIAYVIEQDRAHERILELGLRTSDGRVEVRRGLKAGEQLVVRGSEALREGAQVRVEAAPALPMKSEPTAVDAPQDAGR